MSRAARYTALGLALFGLLGSSLIATAPAYGDHYRSHSYREVDGVDCLDHRHDRECKSWTRLDADEWDVRGRWDVKVVELTADVDFFQKRYVRHRYDDHKRYDDDHRWKHRDDWRKKRDWKDRDDWRKKCDWKDRDDWKNRDDWRKKCDWKNRDDWRKKDDWKKKEEWRKHEDGKRKEEWKKDEEKRPGYGNSSETEKESSDNQTGSAPPAGGTTTPDSTNPKPDPNENANRAATENPATTPAPSPTPNPEANDNADQAATAQDQVKTPKPDPQPNENANQSAATDNPAATDNNAGTQTESAGGVADDSASTTNQSANSSETADTNASADASSSADTTPKSSSCDAAAAKADPNGQAADVCALATARGMSKAFHGKRFDRHYDDDLGTVLFQVWDDDDDRWRTFYSEDVDHDGGADVKFKVRIKKHDNLLFRAVYLGVHDDIRGSISRVVEID